MKTLTFFSPGIGAKILPMKAAYPWLDMPEHIQDDADMKRFDRDACANGTKEFLRRITSQELALWREVEGPTAKPIPNAALVRELYPGARARCYVSCGKLLRPS